jgi:hypothetical protein
VRAGRAARLLERAAHADVPLASAKIDSVWPSAATLRATTLTPQSSCSNSGPCFTAARTGPARRRPRRARAGRPDGRCVDADDEPEVPRTAGLDAGQRVLEDRGGGRGDPEQLGAGEERVRRGLAGQAARLADVAVDRRVEAALEPRGADDDAAVRRRRDDRARQAGGVGGVDEVGGAGQLLHAVALDRLEERLGLAVGELLHGRVAGLGAAVREERADCPPRGGLPSTCSR